jgi:DNA invertase Pin-like site-specific DNA recombinase
VELGYARVSTIAQDLDRQLDALTEHGIPAQRIYQDKKTGATIDREGFAALVGYARAGDTIVATNLDRVGRNLRECLNLVHELRERGIGIRTLSDPIPINTTDESQLAELAVAMLAFFAHLERVFARERAAHARSVAAKSGKKAGRPVKLAGEALASAWASAESGMSVEVGLVERYDPTTTKSPR